MKPAAAALAFMAILPLAAQETTPKPLELPKQKLSQRDLQMILRNAMPAMPQSPVYGQPPPESAGRCMAFRQAPVKPAQDPMAQKAVSPETMPQFAGVPACK